MNPPKPFRLQVPDESIAELRERLAHTRWPDEPPLEPWSTGTSLATGLPDLVTSTGLPDSETASSTAASCVFSNAAGMLSCFIASDMIPDL